MHEYVGACAGSCIKCVMVCAQVQTLQVVHEDNARLAASNSALEKQLSASSPNTSVRSPLPLPRTPPSGNATGIPPCLCLRPGALLVLLYWPVMTHPQTHATSQGEPCISEG